MTSDRDGNDIKTGSFRFFAVPFLTYGEKANVLPILKLLLLIVSILCKLPLMFFSFY